MNYDQYRALPNRKRAFVAVYTLKHLGVDTRSIKPRELTREEAGQIPPEVEQEANQTYG